MPFFFDTNVSSENEVLMNTKQLFSEEDETQKKGPCFISITDNVYNS